MKKYLIVIISMIVLSILGIALNNILYGTNTIVIANYMPTIGGPIESNTDVSIGTKIIETIFKDASAFEVTAIERMFLDIRWVSIITIAIVIIEGIWLFKKKIFEKNILNIILLLLMCVIPIIVSGIRLYSLYGAVY